MQPRGPEGISLEKVSNGNGTSEVYLAWEHDNVPICAEFGLTLLGQPPTRSPVPRTTEPDKHYPPRHSGQTMFLFCDGHVLPLHLGDIQKTGFFYTFDPADLKNW